MSAMVLQNRVRHLREAVDDELANLKEFQEFHHQTKHHAAHTHGTHTELAGVLEAGKSWMNARNSIDDYLDVVEEHMKSSDSMLNLLESYHHCASGFKQLQASYQTARTARERNIELLQSTFHDVSHEALNLARIVSDGDLFADCDRAEQHVRMVNGVSMASMFLLERMESAGLEPSANALSKLREAHDAISDAWKFGQASCKEEL